MYFRKFSMRLRVSAMSIFFPLGVPGFMSALGVQKYQKTPLRGFSQLFQF
jgi:hypothetical protein